MRPKQLTPDNIVIRDIQPHEVDNAFRLFEEGIMDGFMKYFRSTIHSFVYFSFPITNIAFITCCLTMGVTASFIYTVVAFLLCFGIRFYQEHLWNRLYLKSATKSYDIMNEFAYKARCCYKVAVFDGKIIGTVAVQDASDETSGRSNVAEILRMYVVREYQRRGLGRILMDTAREFCTECGYREVTVITGTGNMKAQSFYRKYGFTEVDRILMRACTDNSIYTPSSVQIIYLLKLNEK
ncbi:uncharacterized protein LOC117124213 [Anneissia japonica]|uniref:uncharacterized protein LOC117124213 n=1 Tax=Anneissia japonica TaxID=1529436 RepID=UPI001425684B|nr:uncharacterized protein LOC117124213 [Anneissia japonica]